MLSGILVGVVLAASLAALLNALAKRWPQFFASMAMVVVFALLARRAMTASVTDPGPTTAPATVPASYPGEAT